MTRDKLGDGALSRSRDPFGTARKLDLHLRARARKGAAIRGDNIYYDGTATLEQQRSMIATCIMKRALRKPLAKRLPRKKSAA